MNIRSASYKDVEAVILENDVLKVTVLPEFGSKTASIFYKPAGYETLWQNPAKAFIRTGYGAPYPGGDISGFDEMFPTISRCLYEDHPWQGVEAPDHGEVWALPWNGTITGDSLVVRVNGVRFPYRLEKRVSLEDRTLMLRYTLENLSPVQFHYIWAAHPLFNTCPGMELSVPAGMDRIINAVPGPTLGGYGRTLSFPECTGPGGKPVDLSRVPEKNPAGYQKYYFAGRVPEGWCALVNPEKHVRITMGFPKEEIPYLGVWVNEGSWEDQYNIAPEPASAAMDRIDFSRMWDMGSSIGPFEKKSWYLAIEVSEEK